MKNLLTIALLFIVTFSYSQEDYVEISTKFIKATKENDKKDIAKYTKLIADAKEDDLAKQLDNDSKKLTFFINIYNAFTHNALTENPGQYKDRNAFFKSEQFVIAGNKVNLDIIEHGFLRKSAVKWSLGKFGKMFPPKLERTFRVDKVNWRIHFALNCGAKSCPPVGIYELKTIDAQLEKSAKGYFLKNSSFDKNSNLLKVPSLMSWFRGDFGNKSGVIKIAKDFKVIPQGSNPNLDYLNYDWTLDVDNFVK
ncbi:MAG: DUF547 domain-containing protein [Flavobacterium sp.]|nr:DUF547 domain-containing protein [Flavobacterium sp.]